MLQEASRATLPKRWRLRLRAGALTALFLLYSLLPWLHSLTLGTHAEHACGCRAARSAHAGESDFAWRAAEAHAAHSCWLCDGLASLLAHNDVTDSASCVAAAGASALLAQAPDAPTRSPVNRACRSQAPPART